MATPEDDAADLPADIRILRGQFPGWNFGSMWTTAESGSDRRRLWASRNGVLLSSTSAMLLAEQIRREDGRP
jgi:hypothetical protein